MKLPAALALFCEDIRAEISGTDTLVGVLPDNIMVPRLPSIVPKFATYIRIFFDPKEDSLAISSRLVHPDGQVLMENPVAWELVKQASEEATRDGNPYASIISRMVLSPFHLKIVGGMQVVVRVGDQQILAGQLNVKSAETTGASSEPPQPFEQSSGVGLAKAT